MLNDFVAHTTVVASSSEGTTSLPHHHGSHRGLLSEPRLSRRVEAIVVPTSRPSSFLQTSVNLAKRLDCVLVVLCSKKASASAAETLAKKAGIELIAVDIAGLPTNLMPHFDTTAMLAGTQFECHTDIWVKRNLGLLLSRLIGWERIVFLDDDIIVADPYDLHDAVRALDSYACVGLTLQGFPDNSMVCHAYREVGGAQETFISGGALAVGPAAMTSFFPSIYNEDWFFLLDNGRLRPSATIGRARQKTPSLFSIFNVERAEAEEFGDCLAEGMYWLLDHDLPISSADTVYWQQFLTGRLSFIDSLIEKSALLPREPWEKRRIVTALAAARSRSESINPNMCVDYLLAWQADRDKWQHRLDEIEFAKASSVTADGKSRFKPEKALTELGLMECSKYSPARQTRELSSI